MSLSSARLDALESLIVGHAGASDATQRVIGAARLEARTILTAGLDAQAEAELAQGIFCAAAVAGLAAAGSLGRELGRALTTELGGPQQMLVVALAASGHPSLAAAATNAAASAQAALLLHLGDCTAVEIWRPGADGKLAVAFSAGDGPLPPAARPIAAQTWKLDAPQRSRSIAAVPIRAHGVHCAVLVWRSGDVERSAPLAERAAAALAAPLQQALAVERNQTALDAMVAQPERRLRRLALDLHDGALQDAALIAGELRRLEDDLRPIVAGTTSADQVREGLEALAALVAALDNDLREVATSVEGPGMLRRPFADAIEAIVRVFRARTPIVTTVDIRGDADAITDSQRIAVFRVVQEALTNVRKHSDARHVTVKVHVDHSGLEAEIRDDGSGFDAERAMDAAAKRGSIGLLGMVERVRLLGGNCEIASKARVGTTVRLQLPTYKLPTEDEDVKPR